MKDLLILLKEQYQHDNNIESVKNKNWCRGICYSMHNLILCEKITSKQFYRLENYFKNQKPSRIVHPEFFNNENFINGTWWWLKTYDGHMLRLLFLDKLISLWD